MNKWKYRIRMQIFFLLLKSETLQLGKGNMRLRCGDKHMNEQYKLPWMLKQ